MLAINQPKTIWCRLILITLSFPNDPARLLSLINRRHHLNPVLPEIPAPTPPPPPTPPSCTETALSQILECFLNRIPRPNSPQLETRRHKPIPIPLRHIRQHKIPHPLAHHFPLMADTCMVGTPFFVIRAKAGTHGGAVWLSSLLLTPQPVFNHTCAGS